MKYILSLLFVFGMFLSPAHATPISQEIAQQYYQNCKAKQDQRFSAKAQDQFCACTASQLMTSYTLEDMQATAGQDQAARDAINKMVINVYAPCIQYPATEYHYRSCISNPKTKALGNPEKLCQCAASQVASHLKANAAGMFRQILQTNPNVTDPMQALYDNPQFQEFAQSKLMGCVLN
jgi:hypothetical protein